MAKKKKFPKEVLLGFGHPYVYKSGLDEGIMFYSDTDKRLSNTREIAWPEILHISGREVPEYELILRRKTRGTNKRWKSEEDAREKDRQEREAAEKRNSEKRCDCNCCDSCG
jgi:hypothetical protein